MLYPFLIQDIKQMKEAELKESNAPASEWHVYIVCCRDNSFYTGITTDLMRRMEEHNSAKKGAKYTRTRRPVELVYSEKAASRSIATRREEQIKKLPLASKRQLIKTCQRPGRLTKRSADPL